MRSLLLLLLPVMGFAQTEFRAEFNYLVPDTPVEGGDYRLRGLYSDGDALGFPVDSVTAGKFFYDAKGRLYEIVYSNAAQPLTIEVDTVGHSFAPTLGTGLLTDRTVNIDLPFETSKLSGKLRSLIEVDTRLKLDSSYLVDLGRLTDVDTTGKTAGSIILYDTASQKWEAQPNSINNLTDGRVTAGGMYLGNASAFNANGLVIGRNVASNLTYPLATTNVLIGYNIVTDTFTPSNSLFIGANQKHSSGGGASYNSLAIGNNVALNGKVVESTVIGISAAPNITGNLYNTIIGGEAASNITGGGYNTIIGHRARLNNGSDNNSIVIGGASTYTGVNTGKGSNTAVFGNSAILGTYLYGNLNLNGYGLGNREASDLGKTGSGYFLEVATDGTLVESVSTGGGVSNLGALTDVDTTGKTDGSIILYDAISGNWEAQENSIDNLTDGYKFNGNIVLGRPFVRKPTSVDYANIYLGVNAGPDSLLGYANIAIGQDVFRSFTADPVSQGNANIAIGAQAMNKTLTGFQNVAIGRNAFKGNLTGSDNVAIGRGAGYNNFGDPDNILTNYNQGIFIGTHAAGLDTFSTNEIAIGYNVVGNGSNTATLGNNNITATYLKGTTNLRGYGLGNKEAADLSKTATDYVLRPASDGTILEQVNDIDGLTDGYRLNGNLVLGRPNFTPTPSAVDYNSIFIGNNAGNNVLGYANTAIGGDALTNFDADPNTGGNGNTAVGEQALKLLQSGFSNVAMGREAGEKNITGDNNVFIGRSAGYYTGGTDAENTTNFNAGVFLGSAAYGRDSASTNEIVIGANAVGNGSNTATLGNNNITATYLKGTTNLRGYGLGNKEAGDLGKTASAYIAGYATDGTLIELPSSGLGISLTDLSVTQNSPGTAGLTYNNTNGVFTYTPPDLSSYLTAEVDGSVTNEIQDLSLTGNTLSLSGDATTVDLSTYLDDQTVVLTQGGIVSISGTYPNFTISATEVDGSVTNEIQDLSLTGNTLSLSNDATTVDLSTYLDDQTVTLTGGGITAISGTYPNFTITSTEVDGSVTNEIQDLSLTGNVLSLSGDATTVDLTESVQDEINNTITAGEGISVVYDDGAGTLTISAPSGAGNTDEQTLSINNATAELSISNGNTVDLSEAIDNQVNNLFVDGTNILSTYDDISNTLTVRTTDALTQIDAITFDNNVTDAVTGRLQYDQDKGTLKFGLANNTPIYLGTDMGWYVKNQSGSSIAKGTPVYVSGTDGSSGRKLISPMIADGSINAKLFLGITAETIANGGDGLVLDHGGIKGVNLSGFSANDVLYVSPTVAGTLVNTEPTAPNLKLPIGYVVNNASNGSLSIRSTVGTYLSENHDVQIASATNGDVLKFDGSKWVDGTDLVDDADADATNEIQTLTISNGLTPTQTGNDYDIEWGGNLTKATTVDGLDNYNILFDNLTSFTTNTVNDVRLNAVSTTYGNNSSLIFDDFTGASITNTGTTNQYTSSLNMLRTGELSLKQDRTYASEQLSQGLTIAAADATLKLFSNSVTNSTSTSINLSPDEVKLITPNVFATTATTGQFLQLTDGATGTVEFATALTAEVDGSVTNEIQDLSLTGNTLSLSSDATTVDLSPYLDDQTVALTGGGITAISGTYPNFTITSTEVDGSVTNEIQDLSLSGNTLSLSGDATTVDLSGYLDEATTASNGLTEVGNDIRLGGTLSGTTLIDIESNNFYINDDGATQTGIAIIPGSEEVNIVGKITGNTELQMTAYGLGNKEASDLSLTGSAYLASFATDGTLIEYPISSISGESTTASNGLTLSGSDVKLGGTLSEITNISMAGFNASIYDVSSNTGFAIQPSSNLIVNYGTQAFDDYGSGNKEAADLSKTKSNYKAAFATDGTLIEVDDIDAMVIACSDETTDITTGTAKVTFRAPHAMTITGVRASLTTASSSGTVTIDINEDISGGGASILGTKLTIDANEKTSTTAATAATITDTAIADDAEITIDIDAAGTGAKGLKVTILYRKN